MNTMDNFKMDTLYDGRERNGTEQPAIIPESQSGPQNGTKERKGTSLVVYKFFHYTTINGLQRLASASTIIGRIFWVLVVLGALAMFSRDLYQLIDQYYSRPVSVVSKLNYFTTMPFPAVTICNVNRIKKTSAVAELQELENQIDELQKNHCYQEGSRNSSCDDDVDEYNEFYDKISYLLSNTNETILKEHGHQFEDFVLSCRFGGKRCRKKQYWTHFWDPEYGNCYTINGRLRGYNKKIGHFSAIRAGKAEGLKLVLNIEQDKYIDELTSDAGTKMVISEPDQMPFPSYDGISLSPGFQTDVSLKRIHIKRVDRFKNGSCQSRTVLADTNHYYKKYNVSYGVQACLHECYSYSQIKKCGCAEYSFLTATPEGKVCYENDEETEKCLNNWRRTFGSCDNSCPEPCAEIIYEPQISFTQWPTMSSVEDVLQVFGQNYSSYNRMLDNVRGNLLEVNVFFQRFRETRIDESLSYGTTNLLADIGGQIGLWAGLSVISLCELIELTALIVRAWYRGRNLGK